MKKMLIGMAVLVAALVTQAEATYYVATTGADTNAGTEAAPFLTISNAVATIDALAEPSGTIHVAAGTYSLAADVVLTNAIKVIGATGNAADVVLDRGGGSHRNFTLGNAGAALFGVTVKNGTLGNDNWSAGGNILITAAGGSVSNCVVSWGWANGYGSVAGNVMLNAGVVTRCILEAGSCAWNRIGGSVMISGGARVENCLIKNSHDRGAVSVDNGSLVNCTVVGNNCGGNASGVYADANGHVENCVILNNTRSDTQAVKAWSGTATNFVNCALDEAIDGGTACILNPVGFADAAAGDYHLTTGATCVDAGTAYAETGATSATDLDGATRVVDNVDIGCYELPEEEKTRPIARFSVSAASGVLPFDVSFTATAFNVTGTITYSWDFNGDGVVDASGTDASVVHQYTEAGTNDVVLTVQGTTPAEPLVVTNKAAFYGIQKTLHVSSGNTGAAYPYATAETAASNIASAVAAAIGGCETSVASGAYSVSSQLQINKAIRVFGETGKPGDVILRRNTSAGSVILVSLNHAQSALCGVTVENGQSDMGTGAVGANIIIAANGGTVSNCVSRNGASGGYYGDGAGVYVADNAPALITHCVISNNTINYDPKLRGIGVTLGGGRMEDCLIANNYQPVDKNTGNAVGGVWLKGGTMVNCTVVSNTTVGGVSGVYQESTGNATNCVIAGNFSHPTNGQGTVLTVLSSVVISATGTNLFVNCATDGAAPINATCLTGTTAQFFTDYAAGDYTPAFGGLLFNAGADVGWTEADTDLAGKKRVVNEIDIGCYESQRTKHGGFVIRLQ